MDAAGMGYTDGSCCGDKVGHGALPARAAEREDKERRGEGFARRGRRAAAVSPREEKERGRGGSGTERGCGIESQQDAEEKGKHTAHKDGL